MDITNLIPASWKTTLFGIAGGLALFFGQLSLAFDDDSTTNPSYSIIAGAVGMIGVGWNARDKKISSQDEGIRSPTYRS